MLFRSAVALVVGIGFVVRLRTAPEPLIPLSILSDREARLAVIANAFGWGPIVGLHVFLPMYLQNVLGMAPAIAGLSVLMLAVTLNVSAGITGTILPQREHYKTIPAVGMAVAIGSVLVLAWRAESLSLWEFETVIAIIGIGFGAMPPLAATALQNNVSIHNYGSAVATMQFSRNLYATIMVAVFGAIVLVAASDGGGVAHGQRHPRSGGRQRYPDMRGVGIAHVGEHQGKLIALVEIHHPIAIAARNEVGHHLEAGLGYGRRAAIDVHIQIKIGRRAAGIDRADGHANVRIRESGIHRQRRILQIDAR